MANYHYEAACKRHMADAELLESERRKANASQLYGYAAECALIGIALKRGMASMGTDGVEGVLRTHINLLWPEFISMLHGRGDSALLNALGEANPFSSWRNRDRYTDTGCDGNAELTSHRRGAACARAVFDKVRTGSLQ